MSAPLPKILAIDDTPANLMTLGSALEGEFELQFATSGPSGIELALQSAPDLILLDVMMPEMDGFETFRRIAAQPTLQDIPVIFVTALDNFDAEVTGLSLGAADYITKPINVVIARQRIRNLLEREGLRKEIQLQAQNLRKLWTAVEQSPASVAITNLAACLEYVNPRFTEITGYSAAEVLGQNPRMLQSGLTPKATHLDMWDKLTHGQSWAGELINKRKNGELYWEEGQIAPVKDATGNVTHYVAVKTDISARKRAEELLRASAERLNEAQRMAKIGNWTLDVSTGELTWSDEVFRLFEIDPQRFGASYEAFLNGIHPQDRDAVNRAYTQSLVDRTPYAICHRLLMHDGRIKWVEECCTTRFDASGKPLQSMGTVQDITERKLAEDKLRESEHSLRLNEEQMAASQEIGGTGSWSCDIATMTIRASAQSLKLFGLSPDPMGYRLDDFLACIPQRERVRQSLGSTINAGQVFDDEYLMNPADGSPAKTIHAIGRLEKDAQGNPFRVLGFIQDITERVRDAKKIDTLLREQRAMLQNDLIGIVTVRDRKIVWANPAFENMLGYAAGELAGTPTGRNYPSDAAYLAFGDAAYPVLAEGKVFRSQIEHVRKDGAHMWVDISGSLLNPATGESLWAFLDITEAKRLEEVVQKMAFFDPLTQLANRRLLSDRLSQAMAMGKRSGRFGALMLLDLDNFKPLNDAHGHQVGDLLLMEVARRLTSCVRETDTVARIGGDEFIVLLGDLPADRNLSNAQAAVVAENIRSRLEEPYLLPVQPEGQAPAEIKHQCTASIGGVVFMDPSASEDEIIKWADTAMYQAKEAGRNAIRFYKAKP